MIYIKDLRDRKRDRPKMVSDLLQESQDLNPMNVFDLETYNENPHKNIFKVQELGSQEEPAIFKACDP